MQIFIAKAELGQHRVVRACLELVLQVADDRATISMVKRLVAALAAGRLDLDGDAAPTAEGFQLADKPRVFTTSP